MSWEIQRRMALSKGCGRASNNGEFSRMTIAGNNPLVTNKTQTCGLTPDFRRPATVSSRASGRRWTKNFKRWWPLESRLPNDKGNRVNNCFVRGAGMVNVEPFAGKSGETITLAHNMLKLVTVEWGRKPSQQTLSTPGTETVTEEPNVGKKEEEPFST